MFVNQKISNSHLCSGKAGRTPGRRRWPSSASPSEPRTCAPWPGSRCSLCAVRQYLDVQGGGGRGLRGLPARLGHRPAQQAERWDMYCTIRVCGVIDWESGPPSRMDQRTAWTIPNWQVLGKWAGQWAGQQLLQDPCSDLEVWTAGLSRRQLQVSIHEAYQLLLRLLEDISKHK